MKNDAEAKRKENDERYLRYTIEDLERAAEVLGKARCTRAERMFAIKLIHESIARLEEDVE